MNIIIRPAKADDLDAVNALIAEVHELHVALRPDIYSKYDSPVESERWNEAVLNNNFYIAEADGRQVGVMEIYIRHIEGENICTRDVIFVATMVVDEAYRNRGVGRCFFEKLKQLKREMGLDGVELQVNARNTEAIEAYKKFGFTEKSINMELLD